VKKSGKKTVNEKSVGKQSFGRRLQERDAPRKRGRWSSDAAVLTLAYQRETEVRDEIRIQNPEITL